MLTYLGIIPARGGSKGIKRKNMRRIGDKPMIQYTFDAALASNKIDTTILTTDDQDIINLAEGCGIKVPFVRPSELARDDTPMAEVVKHALAWYQEVYVSYPEYFIILAPTSPFRNSQHIDQAIKKIERSKKESLVSVCPVSQHPAECLRLTANNEMELIEIKDMRLSRGRQQYVPYYFIDGAIYICKTRAFFDRFYARGTFFEKDSDHFMMQRRHSIDINDWFDLHLARAVYAYAAKANQDEFKLFISQG